jgi:hypothetical protein
MIAQTELSGNPVIGEVRAIAVGYLTFETRVLLRGGVRGGGD